MEPAPAKYVEGTVESAMPVAEVVAPAAATVAATAPAPPVYVDETDAEMAARLQREEAAAGGGYPVATGGAFPVGGEVGGGYPVATGGGYPVAGEETLLVQPPAPRARMAVVEARYYGPWSTLSSFLLCMVFPPLGLVPCFAPCDSAAVVTVVPEGRAVGRRRRRVYVAVPPGVRVGDQLQTVTPDGVTLQVRVPPRTEPGQRLCVEY